MNQRAKDVVLIPTLITLLGGFVFMLWGAWYTGVKLHSPFSIDWFSRIATAPVQLWFVMLLTAITLPLALRGYRAGRNAQTLLSANSDLTKKNQVILSELSDSNDLKEKLAKAEHSLKEHASRAPKVHISWAVDQATWQLANFGEHEYMLFTAHATFSTSNTDEMIALTRVYISTHPHIPAQIMLTKILPGQLKHDSFSAVFKTVFYPANLDVSVVMVFVDVKGNEYAAPEKVFQCTKPN